eukprot:7380784-Prymnesium_polylepis.5
MSRTHKYMRMSASSTNIISVLSSVLLCGLTDKCSARKTTLTRIATRRRACDASSPMTMTHPCDRTRSINHPGSADVPSSSCATDTVRVSLRHISSGSQKKA